MANDNKILHVYFQILPALRSFCIYCAISIIGIYILQSTVFVAVVSLDHRRFLDWRDACCCCYKHSNDYQPNKCSQTSIIQWIFDKVYISFLESTLVKVITVFQVHTTIFQLHTTRTRHSDCTRL